MIIDLTKLKKGQKAVVLELQGGDGLIKRLSALGIREGKTIVKTGAQMFRGPVTVKVGRTQVSLGHGMARKIMVEVA